MAIGKVFSYRLTGSNKRIHLFANNGSTIDKSSLPPGDYFSAARGSKGFGNINGKTVYTNGNLDTENSQYCISYNQSTKKMGYSKDAKQGLVNASTYCGYFIKNGSYRPYNEPYYSKNSNSFLLITDLWTSNSYMIAMGYNSSYDTFLVWSGNVGTNSAQTVANELINNGFYEAFVMTYGAASQGNAFRVSDSGVVSSLDTNYSTSNSAYLLLGVISDDLLPEEIAEQKYTNLNNCYFSVEKVGTYEESQQIVDTLQKYIDNSNPSQEDIPESQRIKINIKINYKQSQSAIPSGTYKRLDYTNLATLNNSFRAALGFTGGAQTVSTSLDGFDSVLTLIMGPQTDLNQFAEDLGAKILTFASREYKEPVPQKTHRVLFKKK